MLRFVRIKIDAESLDSISVNKVSPYGTGAPKKNGPQSVEMVFEAIAPKLLPVQDDSV